MFVYSLGQALSFDNNIKYHVTLTLWRQMTLPRAWCFTNTSCFFLKKVMVMWYTGCLLCCLSLCAKSLINALTVQSEEIKRYLIWTCAWWTLWLELYIVLLYCDLELQGDLSLYKTTFRNRYVLALFLFWSNAFFLVSPKEIKFRST